MTGCTLIKRIIYDRIGEYNEELSSSETAEWMLRLKDVGGKGLLIEEVTLMRRYHNTNFGRLSKKIQLESYKNIIRERMMSMRREIKENE